MAPRRVPAQGEQLQHGGQVVAAGGAAIPLHGAGRIAGGIEDAAHQELGFGVTAEGGDGQGRALLFTQRNFIRWNMDEAAR